MHMEMRNISHQKKNLLISLIRLLTLLLLLKFLLILLESSSRDAVQTENRLVRVLDENVLLNLLSGLIRVQSTDTVNDSTDDTPTVTEVQVHLASELAGLVTSNAEDDVGSSRAGVDTGDEAELHAVGLGEDSLGGPAGELGGVVLHLGGEDGTTLGVELAAPVEGTAGALGLGVELVQGLDDELLVLCSGGTALHDGVDLCADDHGDGLLVALEGDVEATVLVTLGGEGLGLLGLVVEGVGLGEGDLGLVGLDESLQGEVVVDDGGFHGEGVGGVNLLLLAGGLGGLEGCVDGVLVDADHVEGGTVALVEVDLVALVDDDDVPRVDTAGGAHQHGQDIGGGEDGSGVLLGELVDDGILGGGNVVGSTVESLHSALGVLDGGLVVRLVVVVEETVGLEVLALGSIEVQLRQTGEVNLLEHLPVGADVDRGLTDTLGLVVVSPAETTATTATTVATTVAELVTALLAAANIRSSTLEATTSTTLVGSTALTTTATENGATATAETALLDASVIDDGEGGLVLGGCDSEEVGGTGAVHLLVYLDC